MHDSPAAVDQAAAPSQVQDGIAVQNAWVRPTVGEQDATGAYLTITSQEALSLVGVATPAAEIAEVHEMKMDGDIMGQGDWREGHRLSWLGRIRHDRFAESELPLDMQRVAQFTLHGEVGSQYPLG